MENQEIAFVKQGVLATNDWDAYQAIIRQFRGATMRQWPSVTLSPRRQETSHRLTADRPAGGTSR